MSDSAFKPISMDAIAALANKPAEPKVTKDKTDLADRSITNWMNNLRTTTKYDCEAPDHDESIPSYKEGVDSRKRMVAMVNGLYICRHCFVANLDTLVSEATKLVIASKRVEH